jgi:hypothetical protein
MRQVDALSKQVHHLLGYGTSTSTCFAQAHTQSFGSAQPLIIQLQVTRLHKNLPLATITFLTNFISSPIDRYKQTKNKQERNFENVSYLLLCIITSSEAANSLFGKVANGRNPLSELCRFWSATNQHIVQHLTNSEHVVGLQHFFPQPNIQSTNEYVVQHVCSGVHLPAYCKTMFVCCVASNELSLVVQQSSLLVCHQRTCCASCSFSRVLP